MWLGKLELGKQCQWWWKRLVNGELGHQAEALGTPGDIMGHGMEAE